MKAIRNFVNSTVLTLSLAIAGAAATMLVMAYVYHVAQPIIDRAILSLATITGVGMVAISAVGLFCATAIILAVSGRVVGSQWFKFIISRSEARKTILESEFQFKIVERDQQAFLLSRPDSQFVGRNISLESEPFSNNSLPSGSPINIAKWAALNTPANAPQITNATPLLEPAQPAQLVSIDFEAIARESLASRDNGRFIAFGSMGSGKTALAKHVLDYAIQEISVRRGGDVYVIDPHAPRVVWNDDVKVIGAGLDYQSIANFLLWLIADVKERYEMGCGDDSQPLPRAPMFIICEEWNGVIGELQSQKQWTDIHNRTLYMDARKAGVGYFLVSHEHTVKSLGLQGMSNLLNGVEYFVTLDKDAISKQYSAKVGRSFRDKEPLKLVTPGPYNGSLRYSKMQARQELEKSNKYLVFDNPLPKPEPDKPTPNEAKIIEAFNTVSNGNGDGKFSWNKVVKQAFGANKSGEFYHAKVKKTLKKFNIDYN